MPDVKVNVPGTGTPDLDYAVPGNSEFLLKQAFASFDGSGAGASWLPALQLIGPDGNVAGEYFPDTPVSAGVVADTTFGPFLRGATSTPTPPSGSGTQWAFATDDHSALALGTTTLSFSDDFETNDGTFYDTVVSGGKTLLRILQTGFYRVTCPTYAQDAQTNDGPLSSSWSIGPIFNFTGYEYEFGTPIGIQVDDGSQNNWFISSQQLLNVHGAANVTLARNIDNGATGAIAFQQTTVFVERLSDHI